MSFSSFDEFFKEYEKIKKASSKIHSQMQEKIFISKIAKAKFHSQKIIKPAVVKLINNFGKKGVKNALNYVIRNSSLNYAINENNEKVSTNEILKSWGKDFDENENSKDAWHLVFSIKEPCDSPSALKRLEKSVNEVMKNNFYGYKYAFVLHTHQNNPHIHIVLNKRNIFTGKKIHFNSKDEIKDFFCDLRENFANSLNYHGLNYENKNSLTNDLQKRYEKLEKNLTLDSENCKDNINDFYINLKNRFSQKIEIKQSQIEILENEYEIIKKSRLEMLELLNQYKKKNNKKFYKIAKELKSKNLELKSIENKIKINYKTLNSLVYKLSVLNDNQMKHYKEQTNNLNMQRNFIFMFNKIYPNKKLASKADLEILKRVENSIKLSSKTLEQTIKTLNADAVSLMEKMSKREGIFSLNKKLEILDKNIYALKQSNMQIDDYKKNLEILEKNRDFIVKILENKAQKFKNSSQKPCEMRRNFQSNSLENQGNYKAIN